MTFLEFQQTVTRMIRLNAGNADFAAAIKDSINLALYEISREGNWSDLLKVRQAITLVTGSGAPILLPADFNSIERVRYTASLGVYKWGLAPRKGRIPPAPVWGYPRCYEIVTTGAASAIILEPSGSINSIGDTCLIDYYSIATPLVADGDTPLASMWDAEIIRRAEQYMFTYLNKIEQAKAISTPATPTPQAS